MTIDEFQKAVDNGSVVSESPEETSSPSAALPVTSIDQFIPLLTQLQSVQKYLSAAPTFVPQSFQDQIQFVFDGTHYYVYLYFNNQWNQFSVTGGSGVTQLTAGTGISISPVGGTGNVTVTNTGVTSLTAGSGITISTSTGAITISSVGGGMLSATGTDTLTGATTPVTTTHTITHGLGTLPKTLTLQVPQLLTPVPPGSNTTYQASNGWIYLNGSGAVIGGLTVTNTVTTGGLGTTTFYTAATGPGNVSSTGSTTGGTGAASVTVNNITSTTFDIVYNAIQSSGSSSFSFPTVTWLVMA